MATPFREPPRLMMCPRCGDVLERVSDGVRTCTRCEGAWLANPTLDQAFGTTRWPAGASAWWRRALECPACAAEGVHDAMTPVLAGELIVDRCAAHGVWLDHGELGRLIGAPNVVELEAFYERLKPGGELPPALVEQRRRRQAELERRQREIEAYRAKLEAEQAKLAAEKQAAQEREAEAERAAERERLLELRTVAQGDVFAHEKQLVALREQVRGAEGKLADSRARLMEIDRQLDALSRR
ncbi:MAG TPA: zf-TFIIB domain-containing protein [Kofleriaceae bacterium]